MLAFFTLQFTVKTTICRIHRSACKCCLFNFCHHRNLRWMAQQRHQLFIPLKCFSQPHLMRRRNEFESKLHNPALLPKKTTQVYIGENFKTLNSSLSNTSETSPFCSGDTDPHTDKNITFTTKYCNIDSLI